MDFTLIFEPAIFFELLLHGLVRGSIYTLMAVGLALIFGILGVVNFAQGEFYMLGAYVTYFACTILGLPMPLAIILAIGSGLMLGMLVERSLLRPLRRSSGRNWILDSFVVTIGLMIVGQNLAQLFFGTTRRGLSEVFPGVVSIGDISIGADRIAILLASVFIVSCFWAYIKFSRTGSAIRATAQNPEAAQSVGINIDRMHTIAFGIGCALAAAAGSILISVIPAFPTAGQEPVLKSFAVVILGGLGSVSGAIAAGIFLGLLEAYSSFFLSAGWQSVVTACLVILALIIRPTGLFAIKGTRS